MIRAMGSSFVRTSLMIACNRAFSLGLKAWMSGLALSIPSVLKYSKSSSVRPIASADVVKKKCSNGCPEEKSQHGPPFLIAIYEYTPPPTEILIFRPEPFVDRGLARRNGHFTRSYCGTTRRES